MEAEEGVEDGVFDNEQVWHWPHRVHVFSWIWLTLITLFLAVRVYDNWRHPPGYAIAKLNVIGYLILITSWTYALHAMSVYELWYFGDYVTNCDLETRLVGTHFALIHTSLCIFFAHRLDIVQSPVTFWWDRKRYEYLATKYAIIGMGFVMPVLWFTMARGTLQAAPDGSHVFCAIDISSNNAKIFLPMAAISQLLVYVLVFFYFVRPVRHILEAVESLALRQLLAKTSYWNIVMLCAECIVLFLVNLAMLIWDESKYLRSEIIGQLGHVDMTIICFCVVQYLKAPEEHMDEEKKLVVLNTVGTTPHTTDGSWGRTQTDPGQWDPQSIIITPDTLCSAHSHYSNDVLELRAAILDRLDNPKSVDSVYLTLHHEETPLREQPTAGYNSTIVTTGKASKTTLQMLITRRANPDVAQQQKARSTQTSLARIDERHSLSGEEKPDSAKNPHTLLATTPEPTWMRGVEEEKKAAVPASWADGKAQKRGSRSSEEAWDPKKSLETSRLAGDLREHRVKKSSEGEHSDSVSESLSAPYENVRGQLDKMLSNIDDCRL